MNIVNNKTQSPQKPLQLLEPHIDLIPSYLEALDQGWHPTSVDAENAIRKQRQAIATDAAAFMASRNDLNPTGSYELPDGTTFARLPMATRYLWDGAFCGSINFRWAKGTPVLPPNCLGHIGYSVCPWKQRLGYATEALAQMLVIAKELSGLPFVDLTTDLDNEASQKVIKNNGGYLVETIALSDAYKSKATNSEEKARNYLWRIDLNS